MRKRVSGLVLGSLIMGVALSGCATQPTNAVIKQKMTTAYQRGLSAGKQMELAKMERIGIERKTVGPKIVGGVYIPAHQEYVIAGHSIVNDALQSKHKHVKKAASSKNSIKARMKPVPSVNEVVETLKPTPKIDPNAQAKLFENLVNTYNFKEAQDIYNSVVSKMDTSKVKDKYDFYMAMGRFLMVQTDYKKAYDSYLKAYLSASDNNQKLKALSDAVTAAKLYGDSNLEFTAWLNLGDFRFYTMHDKIGALEDYYHALKIKSNPEVNLRIANILQGLGKDQLAKAFTLKAYILGERNGE